MAATQKRRMYLGLGFVLVVYLIFAWLIPNVIKWSIETAGAEVAGAEVNVDDVSVSYIPLALTISQMQVTDSRQPQNNLFQLETASAELEWLPLLSGRAVISELAVSSIALDKPRAQVGEVYVTSESSDEQELSDMVAEKFNGLSSKLPSVDEILQRETLTTRSLQQQLQNNYQANQNRILAAREDLPTAEDLARYQKEVNEIVEQPIENINDLQQRQQQLNALKQEIRQQRSHVEAMATAVDDGVSTLKSDIKQLSRAPAADARYLADKYTLDAKGSLNITSLILGDEARYWAETALYWYQTLAPYIDLSSTDTESSDTQGGEVADNLEPDNKPQLIIRNALFSMITQSGDLVIKGQDISDKPQFVGRPTVLTIKGDGLENIGQIDGLIQLNQGIEAGIDSEQLQSSLTLDISGWNLDGLETGIEGIQWQAQNTNTALQASVSKGILDAQGNMKVGQSKFLQAGSEGTNQDILETLNQLDSVSFGATALGSIDNPDVTIQSDLDKALKRLVSQRIKKQTKAFKKQVDKKLTAEVKQLTSQYQNNLSTLTNEQDLLSDQSDSLGDLLKQGIADLKQQKKNEFVRSAKEKLRSFF